ncbi:hypothetical protein D3C79_700220 [compost metagenome]
MGQAEEVLFVEVVQVAVVVLGKQVLGDLVVATGVVEGVAALTSTAVGTCNRQRVVIGGVTTFGVLQLTADQGQVLDFVRSDLTTFKGLRQQSTVVVGHDRQLRHQRTEACFSLGELDLAGQAQAAEIVDSTAVAFTREYSTASAAVGFVVGSATTGVELDAQQADGIDTKADGTFGVTGGEVENEALAPLFSLGWVSGAATVVGVDVEVAGSDACLAVFNETGSTRLLGQNPNGHGKCQGGLVHVLLLYVLILVCRLRQDLCVPLDVDWRLAPKGDRLVNRNHSFHYFGLMRQRWG